MYMENAYMMWVFFYKKFKTLPALLTKLSTYKIIYMLTMGGWIFLDPILCYGKWIYMEMYLLETTCLKGNAVTFQRHIKLYLKRIYMVQ